MNDRSCAHWSQNFALGVLALTGAGVTHAQMPTMADEPSSAEWLSLLPDDETTRRFILDCTGCHQFDERIALKEGRARTAEEWQADVARMLGFAGATTGFPVIAADRDPEATAEWLVANLADRVPGDSAAPSAVPIVRDAVREYALPVAQDLPHDVAIQADGRAIVTGMLTHQMYVLDPESGAVSTVPIPRPNANPRALDIDSLGNWWVVLGNPQTLARFTPGSEQWDFFEVGVYPHSLAIAEGAVWYNGHFTYEPEVVGRVDAASGQVRQLTVPRHPNDALAPAGPVPYEIRVGPNGWVWGSELQGNRVFRLDPASGSFRLYTMPDTWSGPRRLDVDATGIVWIPAYSANGIYRLDPSSGGIMWIQMPTPNTLPYVVRLDETGAVWIGTAAADAIFKLDPESLEFTMYPTPSRGALMRHMAIAPNGDVWVAYGASPGRLPATVARVVSGR